MDEFDEMMQSLGMGSDEDEPAPPPLEETDSGDDFDMSGLEGLDELEALLGAGGGDDTTAEPTPFGTGDDLDAQLAAALAQDQEAVDDFEALDMAPKVSSRSVYDGGSILDDDVPALIYSKDDGKTGGKKKRGKLFAGLTVRKILVAGFILFLIFVGGGAAAVVVAHAVAQERLVVDAMSHFTPIEIPQNVANNANFIPIHERLVLSCQSFTFSRMSAGYLATYVYFDEVFDPEDYIILLYDQRRRLFVRQQFDLQPDPLLGTILRFDPIIPGVRFLTLHIQNKQTREYGAFNFRLMGQMTFGAPVFLNHPLALVEGGDPNSGIRISNAAFSNIDSSIYFSFGGEFEGVGLRKRGESNDTMVLLRDNFGGATVFTEQYAIAFFEDSDAWVGRATFGPLLSLHSYVDIVFRDLYYVYEYPPVDIPLRHLSGRNQDYPHSMYIGPFILNLEAMAQQGHLLVLVLHGTDTNGQRLPTHVEASLHIDLGRGEYILLPTQQVNVSPRGTDVVFDLMPYIAQLRDVHIDRYTLVLRTAEFGVPEVSVSLNLANAAQQPGTRRENVILSIESAFMSRLAYMSNEIALHSIIGFAPELLHDAEVMRPFAQRNVNERPMYNVTLVAGDFIDNYTFLAVVESEWAKDLGTDTQFLRTMHRVIARSSEGIWSIVSDTRF
ncbi:MAG: hypothetical protein FWC16_10520 [Defluviitaleaceae bacterium]|nr:hypothetical protein [Defluviitaleaceae bacterium]MCL2275350.1 hypothetical protein [Defluviitaleaceae bacterium]